MRPLLLALALLAAADAGAQRRYADAPPRVGVGFEAISAVLDQDVIPNGPSLGLRGRVALPVNRDVSVAAGLGIGAHLFEGSSDTRFVLSPQATVIVTIPSRSSARYVFGGAGGMLPLTDGGGGPTLHVGYGVAIPLTETSLFAEVNPQIVVGEDETVPVLAIRGGVIF